MNRKKVAEIIKNYYKKSYPDRTPSMTFILERSLSLPPLKLLIDDFTNNNVKEGLKLLYIAFFMLNDYDYETAVIKTENELYEITLLEVGNLEYDEDVCDKCNGTGDVDCPYCEDTDENECDRCWGDGKIDCPDCNGNGYQKSDNQIVYLDKEKWIITYNDSVPKLIDMSKKNKAYENVYELVNSLDGSLYLLMMEESFIKLKLNEFENKYGDYNKGSYIIDSVNLLKNSTHNFKYRYYTKSIVIR